jgi:hypothetical protein
MLKTSKLLILHTAHTAWNGHTGRGLCTGLCTAPDRFQRLTEGQEPQLEQPQAPFYCLDIDPDAIASSGAPAARTGRPQRPFAVPGRPTASPPPLTPPVSPFRRLLPFGLDEFFYVPPEWRSHRRRPSEFFVQMIPAFRATGDMLFDSEHFSLGEFLQGVALHHHD